MRRVFITIIAFSGLLLSCVKQPEPVVEPQPLPFSFDENLLRSDSLMQQRPDSALVLLLDKACLVPTGCDDLSDSGKACIAAADVNDDYRSLLLSEALYKTGNAQLNRFRSVETCHGASLQEAVLYFDSLYAENPRNDDLAVLSARAHYMNGVGFYENDSVVEACREYLETLDFMENHFHDDDFVGYRARFMGLLHTRLAELFFYYGSKRPAIDSYKNAAKYFSRIENFNLSKTYKGIGSSYYLDNNLDSAILYHRKSISAAKRHNNSFVYGMALSESADLYYELGFKDSAFIVIRKALELPTDEDNLLTRYYIYGSLFAKECQYDSAICYLEKGKNREQFATRTVSAELLMKCYQAIGDTAKAQYYKNIYGEKLDEYRNVLTTKAEVAKIYEAYKQDKLQKEHSQRIRKQIIIGAVFSVFLITAIAVAVIHNKNKINKVRKQSHDDIEEKDKALAEMKRKMEANPFINEPICKQILDVVSEHNFKSKVDYKIYEEYALSKSQIMLLRDAVDRHYDNFTQTLNKTYPQLTTDDINYCCLYLLGLKDADISALIQKNYSVITRRRHKFEDLSIMDKIHAMDCNTII